MPPVVPTILIPSGADRVAILVNPKAGAADAQPRAMRLAELLGQQGLKAEVFTDLAAAAAQANRWHAEGSLRALVGVGGDGTAAELVNRTDEGVPLAILPAGNANLLAGYFQLGEAPEALSRTIAEGRVARVDAGMANGHIFLLMVGCGFDAEVVRRLHGRRTGHAGNRHYVRPIAAAIWNYEYPEMRVELRGAVVSAAPCCGAAVPAAPFCGAAVPAAGAGETPAPQETFSARWLFACNLPCYGGGLRIAPESDGFDGLLDVCSFRGGGLWSGFKYVTAVLLGRHRRMADCTIVRAAAVAADLRGARALPTRRRPWGISAARHSSAAGPVDVGSSGSGPCMGIAFESQD